MNAANQEVVELEPEVTATVPTDILVTWTGSAFTVSNVRSGDYFKNGSVTWKVNGLNFKQNDTLTIESDPDRTGFVFSYQGICLSDGVGFDINATLPDPTTLPRRESWDPPPVPTNPPASGLPYKMLVPYILFHTPAGHLPKRPKPKTLTVGPGLDDPLPRDRPDGRSRNLSLCRGAARCAPTALLPRPCGASRGIPDRSSGRQTPGR